MTEIEDLVFYSLIALIVVLAILVLGVYGGRSAYADMKCAERGFPQSKVTIDLTMYCMNLDGSVTVRMEKP